MYSLKQLINFHKQNLSLTDIIILNYLKTYNHLNTINQIPSLIKINIKERQIRNILLNLQNQNLLVKHKTKCGIIFFFSHVNLKKSNQLPFKKINLLKIKNKLAKFAMLYRRGYLHNNIYKVRRYDNVINNIINIKDEEYTLNNNTKQTTSHNFVVNKNNYNYIKTLKENFKKDFPTKNAYINTPLPSNFNYDLLKQKVLDSVFLTQKDNLGFNWFIKNYQSIINNFYKTIRTDRNYNGFSERTYSQEELDSLFD